MRLKVLAAADAKAATLISKEQVSGLSDLCARLASVKASEEQSKSSETFSIKVASLKAMLQTMPAVTSPADLSTWMQKKANLAAFKKKQEEVPMFFV